MPNPRGLIVAALAVRLLGCTREQASVPPEAGPPNQLLGFATGERSDGSERPGRAIPPSAGLSGTGGGPTVRDVVAAEPKAGKNRHAWGDFILTPVPGCVLDRPTQIEFDAEGQLVHSLAACVE
jgi:hypothetical protein